MTEPRHHSAIIQPTDASWPVLRKAAMIDTSVPLRTSAAAVQAPRTTSRPGAANARAPRPATSPTGSPAGSASTSAPRCEVVGGSNHMSSSPAPTVATPITVRAIVLDAVVASTTPMAGASMKVSSVATESSAKAVRC